MSCEKKVVILDKQVLPVEKSGSHPLANNLVCLSDNLFLFAKNNTIFEISVKESNDVSVKEIYRFYAECIIEDSDFTLMGDHFLFAVVDFRGIGYAFNLSRAENGAGVKIENMTSLSNGTETGLKHYSEPGQCWISFCDNKQYVAVVSKMQKLISIYDLATFKRLNTVQLSFIPAAFSLISSSNPLILVSSNNTVYSYSMLGSNSSVISRFLTASPITSISSVGNEVILTHLDKDYTLLQVSNSKLTSSKRLSSSLHSTPDFSKIFSTQTEQILLAASLKEGEIELMPKEWINDKSNPKITFTTDSRILGISFIQKTRQCIIITVSNSLYIVSI